MKYFFIIKFVCLLTLFCQAKPLEVEEANMPELSNEASPFRGKINHDGYVGHTWVTYPHVENPGKFGYGPLKVEFSFRRLIDFGLGYRICDGLVK
jgi:hypothetical protein